MSRGRRPRPRGPLKTGPGTTIFRRITAMTSHFGTWQIQRLHLAVSWVCLNWGGHGFQWFVPVLISGQRFEVVFLPLSSTTKGLKASQSRGIPLFFRSFRSYWLSMSYWRKVAELRLRPSQALKLRASIKKRAALSSSSAAAAAFSLMRCCSVLGELYCSSTLTDAAAAPCTQEEPTCTSRHNH